MTQVGKQDCPWRVFKNENYETRQLQCFWFTRKAFILNQKFVLNVTLEKFDNMELECILKLRSLSPRLLQIRCSHHVINTMS